MKRALLVSLIAMLAASPAQAHTHFTERNPWIKMWRQRDQSIWSATHAAASAFSVSETLMREIVQREGGNHSPRQLRASLCRGWGSGWNTQGSAAFGPMQYMLDYRGACFNSSEWGTFGAYDDRAFTAAKRRGVAVPFRFKHPASNVGQAVTTAYIISIGEACVHWSASINC